MHFFRFGMGEEIESLGKLLSELREWLEDIPVDIGAEQLKDKKRELMRPIRKLRNRRKQKEVFLNQKYINKIAGTA